MNITLNPLNWISMQVILPNQCMQNYSCSISNFNQFMSNALTLSFSDWLGVTIVLSGLFLFLKTKTLYTIILSGIGSLFFLNRVYTTPAAQAFYGVLFPAIIMTFMMLLFIIYKRMRE